MPEAPEAGQTLKQHRYREWQCPAMSYPWEHTYTRSMHASDCCERAD